MLKKDLEILLDKINNEKNEANTNFLKLKKEYDELKIKYETLQNEIKAKNEKYHSWEELNGEFLEKIIENYLINKLGISLKCDYGGYLNIDLLLGNNSISNAWDSVIIDHNSLDE